MNLLDVFIALSFFSGVILLIFIIILAVFKVKYGKGSMNLFNWTTVSGFWMIGLSTTLVWIKTFTVSAENEWAFGLVAIVINIFAVIFTVLAIIQGNDIRSDKRREAQQAQ